jgi:signal transduction histidine kinase
MRSLRARIFLTVWPLFVLAILAVGALSSRSARIELAQFEQRAPRADPEPPLASIAERIAADWPMIDGVRAATQLRQLARTIGDSVELALLDTAGVLLASSDAELTAADVRLLSTGMVDITRKRSVGRERQLQRLVLSGTPIVTRDGVTRGRLVLLPGDMPALSDAQTLVAGIQRSLWLAVLLACVLAAVGTWLLAYPLVSQVQRLTAAASQVQAKALSTRVRVSSRDELGELEQSFNRMADSLEQTESTKRQLISDVAHELRTPLTNVIGLLEAMRDGLREPDADTLRSTHEEALLLKQLVDELQELALADAGALIFDIAPLDVTDVVRRAADAFQAATPTVRLVVPEQATMVRADARRLAQVLRNVMQNAVTHTPTDGQITVMISRREPWVEIAVADTGRGIPAGQLARIWDRFYRVDASRDRSTGGMGLGLALSKRMMEGMGGAISATSEEGVGTVVTLRLVGV